MTEPARADCIVSGGTVLTMTDEVPHPDWSVVIEGSLVAAVGPDEELAGRYGNPAFGLVRIGESRIAGLPDGLGRRNRLLDRDLRRAVGLEDA